LNPSTITSNRWITIFLHERDLYPDLNRHLIWYIADHWKKMGLSVDVVKGIPAESYDRDVILSHIDLTKVPVKYSKYLDRFPVVLNRKVTDISKRHISRNLVSEDSQYPGPVIAKTNNNFGGLPESYQEGWLGRFFTMTGRIFRPGMIQTMDPQNYQVFESISSVPDIIWNNAKMVVERFIPERDGDYFCIRICFFLGDIILNHRVYSKSKVIKGGAVEFSLPSEIPPEIHEIRKNMGIDYGKFDYVVHDGKVHILDVNKTPGILGNPEIDNRVAEKLAAGIYQYF
jgi:hypothetical protein